MTLTTGVPVTISDVTGATTIYCAPYKGNSIALYDGAAWNIRTSAQFSLALGTLTAALPYDVFCYDNSTVPTLEFLAWSSATARATALAYQDGVLVKSGATTRRYLGTFYTTATTTTEDSGGGTTTQVGGKRFLWNYYNRVARQIGVKDTTASWTYATGTIRQANGASGNKVEYVIGVIEDDTNMTVQCAVNYKSNSARPLVFGPGLNSTTTFAASAYFYTTSSSGFNSSGCAVYEGLPSLGYSFVSWNEYGADGTSQFIAFDSTVPVQTGYLTGTIWS